VEVEEGKEENMVVVVVVEVEAEHCNNWEHNREYNFEYSRVNKFLTQLLKHSTLQGFLNNRWACILVHNFVDMVLGMREGEEHPGLRRYWDNTWLDSNWHTRNHNHPHNRGTELVLLEQQRMGEKMVE